MSVPPAIQWTGASQLLAEADAASGIVAGDILTLEAGDLVAADARLLSAASLKCIESALTGESEAVTKQTAILAPGDIALGDRTNMVFMGTSVAAGTGQAVVVATAMKTELGRIAGLIETAEAEAKTPLQQNLDSFGRILVWATLGIVAYRHSSNLVETELRDKLRSMMAVAALGFDTDTHVKLKEESQRGSPEH